MTNQTLTLTDNLYNYILDVSLREPQVLKELRAETAKLTMHEMQISPEQGQLMALLVELINARKTLEIGVFTGYSSLAVALALPADGKVIACDVNEEWTSIAKKFWQQANVAHKIDLRLAPALQTLDELINNGEQESFDFVFIDADKQGYDAYYEKSLQLTRRGGLIMLDNMLRAGAVVDLNNNEESIRATRELNKKLHHDERVSISLLPVSDGITLARKR
jgi:predicted O-methyltransferase YrrM